MNDKERETQFRRDLEQLSTRPEFKRFLYRVIQLSGLLDRVTDGSEGRDRYNAGRRDLGLDILDMAEKGQPILDAHPDGPLLTLIQVLREETTLQPSETKDAKVTPARYNRNDDLLDEDDPA